MFHNVDSQNFIDAVIFKRIEFVQVTNDIRFVCVSSIDDINVYITRQYLVATTEIKLHRFVFA